NAYSGTFVSVLLGNGDGSFQNQATFATGAAPKSVAIGDVNGDGKPDLAVANTGTTSQPGSNVSVLLGNGDGSCHAQTTFLTGTKPHSIALGDMNGDGKPDLAVANVNSNSLRVLLGVGDGSFQAQQTFTTGTSPRFVALGDLNADGRPDLAVANRTD